MSESAEHSDLVRKPVKSNEMTVGEYPSSNSWKDKLSNIASFIKRNPGKAAAGAAAATLIATGTADNALNTAGNVVDAATRPLEAVLPETSEDFRTPKNIMTGEIDVRIDGELKARKDPNTSGDIIDWKKVKLVTQEFDPEENVMKEKLIDLSEADGFTVNNLLMVEAQATEGGMHEGNDWGKLKAEDEDGDRFDLYFNVSENTSSEIERKDTKMIPIDYKDLGDGQSAIKPKDPSSDNQILGPINSISPLASQE